MRSFMAVLFNSSKVTSVLGEDLTDLSVSSLSVRTHPRRVYVESCVDAAVRESGQNTESETYPGL